MLMECQARGPTGPDRSYFKLLLIRFDNEAAVDPQADLTPVRKIDPDKIEILGDGGQTNLTAALQTALDRLSPYMQTLQVHPERAEHPVPLVLLFSDGEHNVEGSPQPVAEQIKRLNLDGDPVLIAAAGVSAGEGQPDENTLRAITSPECYCHIANAGKLSRLIVSVGSSGVSTAKELAAVIKASQQ
jgi:uncharacterized protein YegL